MPDSNMQALEQKIDDLISLCGELNRENGELKANAESWQSEREQLEAKQSQAREQVEAILGRLKNLEQAT